jgi:MFS family permease
MSARVTHSQLKVSGRLITAVLGVALFGLIGTRSLSYLAFVALALGPTLAAAILERPGQRVATISLCSLTVATLLPLVMGAIANGARRDLLTSATAWMFVGGAVLGALAIYFVLPAATVWIDDLRATARLRDIRARQAALERDWGAEVRNEAPKEQ